MFSAQKSRNHNDHQTYQHHHPHHHQQNNYLPQTLNEGIIIEEQQQQKHPPNNNIIRSHSTAIFCVPSPSTQQNNNLIDNSNNSGINKQQDYRRTKSIVLPPTNGNGRQTENKNNFKTSLIPTTNSPSLRRFNSQLRSPCRYSSDSLNSTIPSGTLPPFKPYTPPPILSPMRQGSGLFNKIASSQKECLFFNLNKSLKYYSPFLIFLF
uniref:Uncharacterized protein n=1 Tax=Meloidogyne enterolobii TaxID=390850 RepID=A0A6V7X4H9_MELEN|nr:unnamed protein product [Meloidogyne enterolobii]